MHVSKYRKTVLLSCEEEGDRPKGGEAARLKAMLAHGFELARAQGVETPAPGEAIWALMCEAAVTETLIKVGGAGVLKARAAWPEYRTEWSDLVGQEAEPARVEAEPAAIDRYLVAMAWFAPPFVAQLRWKVKAKALKAWALGSTVVSVQRRARLSRQTLYNARADTLERVENWLRGKIAGN